MSKNNNLVAKNYDRRASEYDQMSRVASPWVYFDKPFILKTVITAIKKNDQIIDFGCGAGKAIDLLIEKGISAKNIYGVDISKELITIAKNNIPNAAFQVSDFTKMKLPKQRFDVALSDRSVEYLDNKDLIKFFKNVFLSLKKGGKFYLITGHPLRVNNGHISTYLERGPRRVSLPWGMKVDLFHKTMSDFINAAIRAGFLIEYMEEPPIPLSLKRKDPKKFAHYKSYGATSLHLILVK